MLYAPPTAHWQPKGRGPVFAASRVLSLLVAASADACRLPLTTTDQAGDG